MNDYDVIVTEHNEFMYRWEAKKYGQTIIDMATKEESIAYVREYNYHQQVANDNQQIGSYHELPD